MFDLFSGLFDFDEKILDLQRQLSSALEDNGRLQRQLFTAKERVVELDSKLAIAINHLRWANDHLDDRWVGTMDGHNIKIEAFLKDQ